MLSLSSNLKKLIKQFQLTPTKLHRLTGVAQPIIHQIVSGKNRNPKLETLKPLSAYFKISISQLIGEVALPDESPDPNNVYNWRKIPIIRWKDTIDWPATRHRYLNNQTTNYFFANSKVSDRSYALVLDNQAAEPFLPKGAHLVADPNRKPKNGNFVVAHSAGKQTACLRQIIMTDDKIQKILSPSTGIVNKKIESIDVKTGILAVITESKLSFL